MHTITLCSVCEKRLYGVMDRTMNIRYYEDANDVKTRHGHTEKWQPVITQISDETDENPEAT